ncbi:hypothetical protein [Zavarzinia aquatilis]|uniref:Glycosyltransferase RgtA/B/C/D-like domain-containing protein n=1 Tax=Zavarzinia aquatilis TaxID=2211142 RepID=A0A317DVC4_9PROT|nr:hypothetical protein [Zavarzinia aquatilis]PWR18637.1 hypothetical protein DKG74_18615 [Zavarzinia aquatilis]
MNRTFAGRLLPFLFILAALALHLRLAGGPDGAIGAHRLLDTDSYTRLLRVEQLWQGGGWWDNTVTRMGAPEGMPLHWTRPLDLLILGPAMVAAALGVPQPQALWWSGMLICPVLHIIACLLAVWAARALWSREVSWFAGIMLLAQPIVLAYGAVGRADHHVLILLCAVVLLGAALRAAMSVERHGMALLAGAAGALGVWVGPEALLVVVPILAAFGLLFVAGRDEGAALAAQGLRIAIGFTGGIALALAVDVEPARWLTAEHDRVSIVHLGLGLAMTFVFAGSLLLDRLLVRRTSEKRRVWRRIVVGALFSVVALAALALAFPGFEKASLSFTDPDMQAVIGRIKEMQPFDLRQVVGWSDLLSQVGGIALTVLWLPFALVGKGEGPARRAIVVLLATALMTLVAGLEFRRFIVEFAAAGTVASAGLLAAAGRVLAGLRWLPRIAGLALVTLGMALIVPLAGLALPGREQVRREACDLSQLVAALNGVRSPELQGPDDPIVLSDDINAGPRIAYETAFRTVAGPYHRGSASLHDALAVFSATDPQAVLTVLRRRDVDYIAVCLVAGGGILRRLDPGYLNGHLLAANAPEFLEFVPIQSNLVQSLALFRVRPAIETPR